MILTKLAVENFGPFNGVHEFDLKPIDKYHPIILFGGKNGCGKTSLFEAIKLCLYGNMFNGYPLSSTKYKNYLKKKVHKNAGLIVQPDYSSVSLEFKYARLGEVDIYKIRRVWYIKGETDTTINEYFEVYKNGRLLNEIEEYQWNEFIRNLIPQSLTNLYFFDGEQIQKLAMEIDLDYENGAVHINSKNGIQGTLIESFYTLFGLDIIERTRIDLNVIKERLIRNSNERSYSRLFEEAKHLNIKKEEIIRRLDIVNNERAQIQNNVNYIQGQIEKQELLISLEGGLYATNRDEYKRKKSILDSEIAETETKIRNMAEGLLPFTIVPEYYTRVLERIMQEDKHKENLMALQILQDKLRELQDKLPLLLDRFLKDNGDDYISISNNKEEITTNLIKLLRLLEKVVINYINVESPTNSLRFLYNEYLSTYNKQKILRWIDEIKRLSSDVHLLTGKLDKLIYEKQEVEKALLHPPPEESIATLLQQLNKLYNELSEEKLRLAKIDEEIRRLEYEYKEIERSINKIMEQLKSSRSSMSKISLIEKIDHILEEYISRIKEDKVKLLEENLLRSLNMLLYKTDMIDRVRIDPNTLSIELYKDNKIVIKDTLSAGERQIYAIALLWALTKSSNKPMPFIIDTPLARLDATHRSSLVLNFFPAASHQVIIFSTDTEIDKIYFSELKPYISHTYHLIYSNGVVNAEKNHFWRTSNDELTIT